MGFATHEKRLNMLFITKTLQSMPMS